MALKDDVTTRISVELLKQLTNPNVATATVRNEAVLDAAVADAEAVFLVEVGVAYDSTDAPHVPVGVDGVLTLLMQWSGKTGRNVNETRQRWERGLLRLAATRGGERRLLPDSTSVLAPSTERTNALPDHDRDRWGDVVPRMPVGGDEQTDQVGLGL